ncbi:hypothetical protein A2311_06250 [candidate division WOR-1 bacterium RIFOXYB2_FULL_48_7]|uniref:Glycosyl transferase family 28 C-terminal domain-containing protein n=1 Tax=candidate division WOR-1 bacterium RIFOXYB2_FULL_48_7 TaxID=1802583 RepID=A0A1F4TVI6_UNCSA|nr:MAG: hypothetical protein A2311_06250 [candidate division WOR-1 bacterium RIFOXYB2_FULL_48_7]
MKPKLLISTYGGHKLGAGHVFRDLELGKCLMDKMMIMFHTDGASKAAEILRQRGIRHIQTGSLQSAIARLKPMMLLYDRPYSLGPMEELGIARVRTVALDYFYYQDKRINAIVNIMNHYDRQHKGSTTVFEGVKYAIIRKEILQRRRKRKPIAHRVKNVLVTFGGADPRNNTKQTIDLLNDLPEERLNITIVIGPIFRKGLERSIKLMLKNGPHKFFIKKRVLNMADLMARTDLAFCGAGTTMMELLTIGCPVVVLPQNEQEAALAKNIGRAGALLFLGQAYDLATAKKKIEALLKNYPARKKLAAIGRKYFDGRGKERIRAILLKELKSGR